MIKKFARKGDLKEFNDDHNNNNNISCRLTQKTDNELYLLKN